MSDHDDNDLRGRAFTILPHDPTQHLTAEEWNHIMMPIDEYLAKHPEKCVPFGYIRCKSLNPLIIDEEAEESR